MERRKNRLINKRFQYKYALILTGVTALAFLMFVIPSITIAPELVETLDTERQLLFTGFFALFSICSISLFIIGVVLTHKIAGPVFAFERCMQNLIHGKFNTELNLRENDELQELAFIFNEFKEFLVSKERDELEALREILHEKSPACAEKLEKLIKQKEDRLVLR